MYSVTEIKGQTQVDSLYIDSLNCEYYVNSPLTIKYTNETSVPLYVVTSLEGYSNTNGWTSIFDDIFMKYRFDRSPIDNSVEIMPLLPKSTGSQESNTSIKKNRTDIWVVDERLLSEYGQQQLYRLKFRIRTHCNYMNIVGNEDKTEEKIKYSRSFYIKKNNKKK